MLNLIKADMYRLIRSKAFWITFIVLISYLILAGLTGSVGTIGVATEVNEREYLSLLDSGTGMQMLTSSTGDNLFYFFLPILILLITSDFTNGAVKNVISKGVSRNRYYISKLIFTTVICSLFVILYEVIPLIAGSLKYGYGDSFKIYNFGRILLTQIPIYFAVISIGVFMACSVQKTAILNGVYLTFFIFTSLMFTILTIINDKFQKLFDYDLVMLIRKNVFIKNISMKEIIYNWTFALIVIVITIISGIVIFNKREIK